MKRPKPLEYNDNSLMLYVTDLENYCNFLEWKIENLNEVLHDHILALDKACEQIVELNEYDTTTVEQWREWALKNERI